MFINCRIAQIPEVVDHVRKSNNPCCCEKLLPESVNSENSETSNIHSTLEATVESLKVFSYLYLKVFKKESVK